MTTPRKRWLSDREYEIGNERHSRKNRRRWCRGRVGVEHQLAIRMGDKYTASRRECGWAYRNKPVDWRWQRWICCEQEYCTACGKILRHFLGDACNYGPPKEMEKN